MKLLLVSALVFLVAVDAFGYRNEWSRNVQKLSYQSNAKYVYRYESQVMTGIPSLSRQYASVKIVCNVQIDALSSENIEMQLSDIQLYELNKEIEEQQYLPPNRQLPTSKFKKVPNDQVEKIKRKLQLSLKFSMSNGEVKMFEVAKGETNWSLNIKRAIAALLQVTITPPSDSKSLFSSQMDEGYTRFERPEWSIDGKCYSIYDVYKRTESEYRVIKSRDYERCIKRNMIHEYLWTQKQSKCNCVPNVLEQTCTCTPTYLKPKQYEEAVCEYDLKKEGEYVYILEATQKMEKRVWRNNKFETTYSNQTLVFVNKENRVSHQGEHVECRTINEPWRMELLTQDEESPMISPSEILSTAKAVLNELLTVYQTPERYPDQLMILYQLSDLIKLMKTEQLSQIYSTASQDEVKLRYLLDGISIANSTIADEFVLNYIQSKKIPEKHAVIFLLQWTTNKVPTVFLLDKFLSLMPRIESSCSKQVHKHAMLCFSALIRRFRDCELNLLYRSVTPEEKKIHTDRINQLQKYEKYFTTQLLEIRPNQKLSPVNEHKAILLLKCLRNAATIRALPSITPYIYTTEQKRPVRVHAVYSLQLTAPQNKMKILEVVSPLFFNETEDREVRMAAFTVMLKCNPVAQLRTLTATFNSWTDRELKTFVAKQLEMFVKQSTPGYEQRDREIRALLSSMRPFRTSYLSNAVAFNFGVSEQAHDTLRVSYLGNETSTLPQALSVLYQNNIDNITQNLLEVGYRADGLANLFSPTHESVDEPTMTLFAKSNDQEVAFYHLDPPTIKRMMDKIRQGPVLIPIKVFTTFVSTPEVFKVLTVNGFTQQYKLIQNPVLDIEGQLRVSMNGPKPEFRLELTRFRLYSKYLSARFMDAGFKQIGIVHGFWASKRLNIGQKAVLSYNMTTNQISFQQRAPTTDKEMYTIEVHQYSSTFCQEHNLPRPIRSISENFKPIKQQEPERKRFSYEVEGFKSVGMNMKVEGDVALPYWYEMVRNRRNLAQWNEYLPQSVRMTIKPAYNAAVYELKYTYRFGSSCHEMNLENMRDASTSSDSWSQPPFSLYKKIKSFIIGSDEPEEKFGYKPNSMTSAHRCHIIAVSSVHNNMNRTASCNITAQYGYDDPSTKYQMALRTPISSSYLSGRNEYRMDALIKRVVNPQTSEIVSTWNFGAGPEGQAPSVLNISAHTRPVYKDGVCVQSFIYGCQDRYGVVYPLWFNTTAHIEWKNSELLPKLDEMWKLNLINKAPAVFVQPNQQREPKTQQFENPTTENKLVWSIVEKPYQQKLDVMTMNKTHLMIFNNTRSFTYFSLFSTPVDEVRPRPSLTILPMIPAHHYGTPYHAMKKCVLRASQLHTFNEKIINLPAESNCAITLAQGCQHQQPRITYQLKRAEAKKFVKVQLLGARIEFQLVDSRYNRYAGASMVVKVNNRVIDVNRNPHIQIKDPGNQKVVAEMECTRVDCAVQSHLFGIQALKISQEDLEIMVDDSNSKAPLCGLCKGDLPRHPSEQQVKEMIHRNKVPGQPCDLPMFLNQNVVSPCQPQQKRHVYDTSVDGKSIRCVSTDKQKTCTSVCHNIQHKQETTRVKCVPSELAERQYHLYVKLIGPVKVLRDENAYNRMPNKVTEIPTTVYTSC